MSKAFVIDVSRCSGCHNCQLSCKDEHCENDWLPYAAPQPPTGQFWMKVKDYPRGTIPKVTIHYVPQLCQHCEHAPCIAAAKNEAVYRREDGLVIIDPIRAQGQWQLMEACPYDVIYWNESLQLPQKCTGCAHLLDNGYEKPRCVEACPTDALQFGDESDLADLIQDAITLQPELGTHPRVYYRNIPGQFIGGLLYDPIAEEVIIDALCALEGHGIAISQRTDPFGDFWFRNLPVGSFTLTLSAPGYETKVFPNLDTTSCINLGDIPLTPL